jgi:hypothetical protein
MCAWGRNIVFETLHVLVGGMFWVLGYSGIETFAKSPIKTLHVLVGGRFRSSSFGDMFWGEVLPDSQICVGLSSKDDMFWH